MWPTLWNDVKLFPQRVRSPMNQTCSKSHYPCHVERLQLKGLSYLMEERHAYAAAMLQMGKIGKK